jgi:hypothetical protein
MQQTRNHPNVSCRSLYLDFTEPLTRSNARFSVLQIESVRQWAQGYFGKFQIFIGNLPQTRRTSSTRPSAIGAQAYGRVTPSSYPCIQRCMKFNVNVKSLIPAGKDHKSRYLLNFCSVTNFLSGSSSYGRMSRCSNIAKPVADSNKRQSAAAFKCSIDCLVKSTLNIVSCRTIHI